MSQVNTSAVPEGYRSGFVAVLGRTNSGKSSLVNAIVGEKVSIVTHKSQTTRNVISGIKTYPDAQVVFLDTPGFVPTKHRNFLGRYLEENLSTAKEGAALTLLVLDSTKHIGREGSVASIARSLRERGFCPENCHSAPLIVALNKIDLIAKADLLPLCQEVSNVFSGLECLEIVPVSAQTRNGIPELEKVILKYIPEGPQLYPEDQVSAGSEAFLAQEIIREKLYLRVHKELPYSLTVAIEKWEESPTLLRIWASIIVAQQSQRSIVVGTQGAVLKEIGTKARIELEGLFNSKVYLELHVKVEEDWNTSRSGLRKVGLEGI